MKRTILVGLLCLALSGLAQARGGGHASGHSATSTSSHASAATASKPAKLYSCPGCNPHDHYVAPHVTNSGSYVHGYMQTNRNSTRNDNFSHVGNVNQYTGKKGTKK